jgi:hypothetical protein
MTRTEAEDDSVEGYGHSVQLADKQMIEERSESVSCCDALLDDAVPSKRASRCAK